MDADDIRTALDKISEQLGLTDPVIALSQADDYSPFEPVIEFAGKGHQCVWAAYNDWKAGKTLALSAGKHGCSGAGRSLLNLPAPEGFDIVKMLYDVEGLKASRELVEQFLDNQVRYKPTHKYVLVGPLRPELIEMADTVSFLVNPDQLSALVTAALYHTAEFAPNTIRTIMCSGCCLLAPFGDEKKPLATIGAMDMAMRPYVPTDLIAFTVNIPMFEQIITMDDNNFLNKSFWNRVRKAREKE